MPAAVADIKKWINKVIISNKNNNNNNNQLKDLIQCMQIRLGCFKSALK